MKINNSNVMDHTYVSPSTSVIAFGNEGVLCASVGFKINDWTEETADPELYL